MAQSALTQPKGSIEAIIAAYLMLDMASQFGQHPFGRPTLPTSTIDDHLAAMKPWRVIICLPLPPLERFDLAVAVVQYDRYPEFLGRNKPLYPINMLAQVSTFPPLFIYHGTEDSAVNVAGTRTFIKGVEKVLAEEELVVKLEPGEHAFEIMVGIEEPWMIEGLNLVTKMWLQ